MFGALSSAHQILVLLALKGGPEYAAKMEAATAETNMFGRALVKNAAAMRLNTERTWMQNQALFTARRYLFYTTLAVTGLAFAVARLGFQYQNTIQTAKVALGTILPKKQLDDVLSQLYKISTLSPFLFQDTVQAFRMLYPAFHAAGISAKDAIDSIQASANGLAVAGKLSTGSLTRVSVQLQHMANIGRPTGQVLTALARDGLPVYPALRKELGLTGASLANLASSGYTAKQVIEALNKYMITTAPYAGAAMRISLHTLQGNWQMFKDILAQAAGRAEGGMFQGLTTRLAKINQILAVPFLKNQRIGIYMVADAIDRSLTPNTHIIINLFILFASTLKILVFEFWSLFAIISLLLRPLDYFASLFGQNWAMMKLLGGALGTLIFLWTLMWIKTALWNAAGEASIAIGYGLAAAQGVWTAIVWLWDAAQTAAILLQIWWNREVTTARLMMILATGATIAYMAAMWLWTAATGAATAAQTALDAALWANPIGLVILAVLALAAGLVILYFKWKWFHDLVNATFKFLWSHPWAAALIPIVGQLIIMAKVLDEIYKHARGIAQFAQHPVRGLEHAAHGITGGYGWKDWQFWLPHSTNWRDYIPGLQHGGMFSSGGFAMVGERGPEIVHLPAASVVQPFSANMMNGAGLAIHVYPQDIYLDSKKIGSVLATAITDREARR
jgi:hypothetical protein